MVSHATFPLGPATREDALDRIDGLVEASQAEDGMFADHAATDVSDPNLIRFFEQYEDEAAFESHTRTGHGQEFETALPDGLAGEPDVRRFDVASERNSAGSGPLPSGAHRRNSFRRAGSVAAYARETRPQPR
ncbi:putative quinol monooxygenase [Salarchaeum sp. JOR-1]|uniref:putative quinol monooxygenase n=1 Tax=Salarchaeum sp. JOR-1 TaxID=2599399 RepID=UPI0011988C20|nr:putative quinol monooxygenase [Salarchaeum sp. JOR-1]QDX41431.1 antibiotic biosynthesis monooxygenase [Salarchaeum sp. JOR-1]